MAVRRGDSRPCGSPSGCHGCGKWLVASHQPGQMGWALGTMLGLCFSPAWGPCSKKWEQPASHPCQGSMPAALIAPGIAEPCWGSQPRQGQNPRRVTGVGSCSSWTHLDWACPFSSISTSSPPCPPPPVQAAASSLPPTCQSRRGPGKCYRTESCWSDFEPSPAMAVLLLGKRGVGAGSIPGAVCV